MKVAYLLPGTTISGGVKVAFQHVRILRRSGIDARVYSEERGPRWLRGTWRLHRRVRSLRDVGPVDVAVGTFWSTIEPAIEVGRVAVHFCQGYEIDYLPERLWPAIDAVYELPTHKWACSPYLVDLIRDRFGQEASWIPQPFDARQYPPPRSEPPDDTFRLLVPNQWQVPVKGLPWALRALRPLVDESPPLTLVRLAQDVHPEEREGWGDRGVEYHVHVPAHRVSKVIGSTHALLCPSRAEGFGLPVLEAMSCARPCIGTDIPPFRLLDPEGRAMLGVPYEDPEALRAAVRRLRDDPELRRRMGRAGRRIAEGYTEERTRDALLRHLGELA